jgi:hypothetical protein
MEPACLPSMLHHLGSYQGSKRLKMCLPIPYKPGARGGREESIFRQTCGWDAVPGVNTMPSLSSTDP